MAAPLTMFINKAGITFVIAAGATAVADNLVKVAVEVKGISVLPEDQRMLKFSELILLVDPPIVDTQNDSVQLCPAEAATAELSNATT